MADDQPKMHPIEALKQMLTSSEPFQFRNNKAEQIQIQSTMLLLLLACIQVNINQL